MTGRRPPEKPGGCTVVRSGTILGAGPDQTGPGQVLICRGRVSRACPHQPVPIDADGCLVAPGLVDIHVHGAHGHDLTDPDPAAWQQALAAHLAAGTTTALATLASTAPARRRPPCAPPPP
ncbi:hypothetical protein [Streptomyces sp. NPDC003435]